VSMGMDVLMKAADLFERDTRTPIAYLAFTKRRCAAHGSTAGWTGGQEAALINLSCSLLQT